MSAATHVPGAGGVVFDDAGRVLVLTLASGEKVFPKGHIEAGETALEAALREVEEETGVKAWCDDPTEFTTSYVNAGGVPRHVTWFRMRARGATPRVSESGIRDARFHPVDEAASLLSFRADRELLGQVAGTAGRGA
ncbi:MAG TPA: NUDIX domain-containing protein [Trueperaceae bacterium]